MSCLDRSLGSALRPQSLPVRSIRYRLTMESVDAVTVDQTLMNESVLDTCAGT